MKIPFNKPLDISDSLQAELLYSLSPEAIDKANEVGEFEVKLIVNGVEHDPKLLAMWIDNRIKYIEEQAKALVIEQLNDAVDSAEQLASLVRDAKEKIMDTFNLYIE